MNLSTSRYQAKDLILESGAIAVGITAYPPRWPVGYPVLRRSELAPSQGLLAMARAKTIAPEDFEREYLAQLDAIGVDGIRQILEEVGGDMVLLCYENVVKGERCHRRMFAAWWEKQTGEEVPELAPAQQELL